MRNTGRCVISGFHSPLEKDVFDILSKGKQPIIIALARGMKSNVEATWVQPLEENRLLKFPLLIIHTKPSINILHQSGTE
jgi:hypothetical protein